MAFAQGALLAHRFNSSAQVYSERDVILYALGLGLGAKPTDPDHLRFVYEKDILTLPTMAVVLAHPGFWARDPVLGIDWTHMLHGEQGLTIHAPIPRSGKVRGESRIADVIDRGPEKGAMLHYVREVFDEEAGTHLATVRQTLVCRGNGRVADTTRTPPAPHVMPARAPDIVVDAATSPQMALIYRLSGDLNPLHVDPVVAAGAGFPAPILHGLATFGVAGLAVLEHVCGFDPQRFRAFDARFSAPVFPGETLRVELWIDGVAVSVRLVSVNRSKVVLDNGVADIQAA
jgi:acyl dehydratase